MDQPQSQDQQPLTNHLSPTDNNQAPQNQTSKPHHIPNKLVLLLIGFIILFTLVLGASVLGFQYFSRQKSTPTKVALPTSVPNIDETTKKPESSFGPEPDNTTNWKTYENTQYGYSLKYPDKIFTQIQCPGNEANKFMLVLKSGTDDIIEAPTCARDGLYNLELTPTFNNINTISTDNYNLAESFVTVDGAAGKKYILTQKNPSPGETWYIFTNFSKGSQGFSMTYKGECSGGIEGKTHEGCEKMLDQILSTFRFASPSASPTQTTKNTVTSETDSWQTFADSRGYAFKYPSDWLVSSSNGQARQVENWDSNQIVSLGPLSGDQSKWDINFGENPFTNIQDVIAHNLSSIDVTKTEQSQTADGADIYFITGTSSLFGDESQRVPVLFAIFVYNGQYTQWNGIYSGKQEHADTLKKIVESLRKT